MKLNVPYDKMTLQVALFKATHKIDDFIKINGEETAAEMMKSLNQGVQTVAEVNSAVAKSNGITVDVLVNSPNYTLLKQEYLNSKITDVRNLFKDKMALTEVESWAVVLSEHMGLT